MPATPTAIQPVRSEWFIAPNKRVRILPLFLLVHVLVAFANHVIFMDVNLRLAVNTDRRMLFFADAILCGLALGGVQAVLLRNYLPSARSWILLTAASAALVGLVNAFLGTWLGYNGQDYVFLGFSFGYGHSYLWNTEIPLLFVPLRWLLVGLSQWLLLRKLVYPAWLWMVASVGGAVMLALIQISTPAIGMSYTLYALCVGITVGLAQGLSLLYFKQKPLLPS